MVLFFMLKPKCVGLPKLRASGGVNGQSCESIGQGLVLLPLFDSTIAQSGGKHYFGLIFSPFFIKKKGKKILPDNNDFLCPADNNC